MASVVDKIMKLLFPTGAISQGYGPSTLSGEPPYQGYAHFHQGIDFAVPTGTPVRAPADGVIAQAGSNGGYGNSIIVNVGNGYTVLQGHLSSIVARVGQAVKQGDIIGYSGSTGYSTGPHIHFEVRQNGSPVDPHSVGSIDTPTDGTIGGTNDGTISTPFGNIPNPLAPIQALQDAFSKIVETLSNPETWLKVGMVIGGVVVISMGMFLIANDASKATTGSSIAGNASKAAVLAA